MSRYASFTTPSKITIVDMHTNEVVADMYNTDYAAQLLQLLNNSLSHTDNGEDDQDTDQPEFYKTGIKYTPDNKPRYKMEYNCPNCSNKGRHYIPDYLLTVSCHRCGFDLTVRLATHDPFPNRDKRGNYFVATTLG
jgi:DNA-directed RNA polymerase subunit RPC12/RpoP